MFGGTSTLRPLSGKPIQQVLQLSLVLALDGDLQAAYAAGGSDTSCVNASSGRGCASYQLLRSYWYMQPAMTTCLGLYRGAAMPVERGCQLRRMWRQRRPGVGTNDSSSDAATDRDEPANGMCLLGLDPLMLTTWPQDMLPGRDATNVPMLEEFAASIAANRIVTHPPLVPLVSTPVANQPEEGAAAVVTLVCTCKQQALS